ncbi:agmatinase [Caldinitratiruptor microaerophilus]|uniref:Agmatinase n=1 Tax=Caldinitratiruptor microaerophilus TaxID=671077 RepID=A0AA35G9T0_9FIRM|nr:agmatinase [Caldinitratiruptor microaerophilus]BDG61803.1 agmatinase [Caldinitratiruptor microaerophilus]
MGLADRALQGLPLERLDRFLGTSDDYASARVAIFGVPLDLTTSYRPGARFGPARLREASYGLEDWSYHQEAGLDEVASCDLGDVALPIGQLEASLAAVGRVADRVVSDGKIPFMVGGEHLSTLPVLEAVARRHPDLALVHLDAHADLREEYLGNRLSHATVIRRCLEHVAPDRLYQFGIRSGTREEYEYARRHAHLWPHRVLEPLRAAVGDLRGRPVYVTLDLDVLDPAFAPGTGTPEPGGIDVRELLEALRVLGDLRVVGFDLVEAAPDLDPTGRTAVVGALIVREALLAFGR